MKEVLQISPPVRISISTAAQFQSSSKYNDEHNIESNDATDSKIRRDSMQFIIDKQTTLTPPLRISSRTVESYPTCTKLKFNYKPLNERLTIVRRCIFVK